jgi:hypothetical protein
MDAPSRRERQRFQPPSSWPDPKRVQYTRADDPKHRRFEMCRASEEAIREGRPERALRRAGGGNFCLVARVTSSRRRPTRAQGGYRHSCDDEELGGRSHDLARTVTLVLSEHFHHRCPASISQGLARNVSIRESPVAKSIHRSRADRAQPQWQ